MNSALLYAACFNISAKSSTFHYGRYCCYCCCCRRCQRHARHSAVGRAAFAMLTSSAWAHQFAINAIMHRNFRRPRRRPVARLALSAATMVAIVVDAAKVDNEKRRADRTKRANCRRCRQCCDGSDETPSRWVAEHEAATRSVQVQSRRWPRCRTLTIESTNECRSERREKNEALMFVVDGGESTTSSSFSPTYIVGQQRNS